VGSGERLLYKTGGDSTSGAKESGKREGKKRWEASSLFRSERGGVLTGEGGGKKWFTQGKDFMILQNTAGKGRKSISGVCWGGGDRDVTFLESSVPTVNL